jgi:hypothetical protein
MGIVTREMFGKVGACFRDGGGIRFGVRRPALSKRRLRKREQGQRKNGNRNEIQETHGASATYLLCERVVDWRRNHTPNHLR